MLLTPASGVERILWIVLIVLVVGYLAGAWLNRQRSKAIGAWLQEGLGKLGGRVAWRWIRSVNSGAEVTVGDARAPYRQLRIGYFLLTREFLPLWGIERLRRKGDLLSLNADLRKFPGTEFEILPLQGALRRKLDRAAGDAPWQWQPLAAGLGLATRDPINPALLRRLTAFTERYGAQIERLSLRQRTPHLVVFFKLQGMEKQPITELWAALETVL